MTCARCGAYSQGDLCRQCEIEAKYQHLADDLASDAEADDE